MVTKNVYFFVLQSQFKNKDYEIHEQLEEITTDSNSCSDKYLDVLQTLTI